MSCSSITKSQPSLCVLSGDGVVSRGKAYGVRSIRVDGNDALAIFSAMSAAREMAVKEHKPVLIEVVK